MRFTRPSIALLGSLAALALGACAGDDSDASRTLQRGLETPVPSADVTLYLRARVSGDPELEDPMRLRATGPYVREAEGELPRLDWEVSADARGMGVTGGLLSTGDNAYVKWLGTSYEVGEERVAEHVREKEGKDPAGELDRLGIDPGRWVVDPSAEGQEEVAGVASQHVSGSLDVERFLDDMDRVARDMGEEGLSPEERRLVLEGVEDPTFDVWVGTEDGVIRRLTAELEFTVPEAARERADGVESGEVSLLLEHANVGGDQASRITAPASSRPIEELLGPDGALGPGEYLSLGSRAG